MVDIDVEIKVDCNLDCCDMTKDFTLLTGDTVTVTKCTTIKIIRDNTFKTSHTLRFIHGNSTTDYNYNTIALINTDLRRIIAWRRNST